MEKVFLEVRSGLVSSVGAEAVLFPLDTLKLRQQVNGGTVLQVLQNILKERGVSGLYQGLIGRLIQTITSNVGFFIWQTVFVQVSLAQLKLREPSVDKLGTVAALVVNMLAQQLNRILTTPVDVVASVNQADPASKGFFHTFMRIARTGGRSELWRGLPVALLLSLNPALMFTVVGKLSDFIRSYRLKAADDHLSTADMFWISGISKAVATLLTYPLIRAKAVIQSTGGNQLALAGMLADVVKREGWGGLYSGVWIMSYKTVLFNSLMMAMKQKISQIFVRWDSLKAARRRRASKRQLQALAGYDFRSKTSPCNSCEMPWEAAKRGAKVIYVDGSWSFLHAAQVHFLREAARRGEHLVLGVHSDQVHQEAMESWPAECYAARIERLRREPVVSTILEDAPWEVTTKLLEELCISRVLGGSVTKAEDCAPGPQTDARHAPDARSKASIPAADPYAECKRRGIFEKVPSLNTSTEHDEWMQKVSKIVFSNVDASIDWRILVPDGERARFGPNPGYADQALAAQ